MEVLVCQPHELFQISGFDNVCVGSQLECLVDVRLVRFAGPDDHNGRGELRSATNGLEHFETVRTRHDEIQNDDFGTRFACDAEGFVPVLGEEHVESTTLELDRAEFSDGGVVVNDQDFGSVRVQIPSASVGGVG